MLRAWAVAVKKGTACGYVAVAPSLLQSWCYRNSYTITVDRALEMFFWVDGRWGTQLCLCKIRRGGERRSLFAEHRSLGFLSCFSLKSTFSLLINREVKSSAFPAAASRGVSHLLWLPEYRPRHERELRGAGGSARWRPPPLHRHVTTPPLFLCPGRLWVDIEEDPKPWCLQG